MNQREYQISTTKFFSEKPAVLGFWNPRMAAPGGTNHCLYQNIFIIIDDASIRYQAQRRASRSALSRSSRLFDSTALFAEQVGRDMGNGVVSPVPLRMPTDGTGVRDEQRERNGGYTKTEG